MHHMTIIMLRIVTCQWSLLTFALQFDAIIVCD